VISNHIFRWGARIKIIPAGNDTRSPSKNPPACMKKQYIYRLIRKVVPGTGHGAGCHPAGHIGGYAGFRCPGRPVFPPRSNGCCNHQKGTRSLVSCPYFPHFLTCSQCHLLKPCRCYIYPFLRLRPWVSGILCVMKPENKETELPDPGILFFVTVMKKWIFFQENYPVSFVPGSETAGCWSALSGCSFWARYWSPLLVWSRVNP
jgi:hypothetical protein